jgi:hypothetical protein
MSLPRPAAWATLETALRQRRPVQATYHGQRRVLCPHVLGWKNGRARVLAYQTGGTGHSAPPTPSQQWRSMFVDEISDVIVIDQPWQTAQNYTGTSNGIDQIEARVMT